MFKIIGGTIFIHFTIKNNLASSKKVYEHDVKVGREFLQNYACASVTKNLSRCVFMKIANLLLRLIKEGS